MGGGSTLRRGFHNCPLGLALGKTEPNVTETKCMHIHGKRIPLLFLTRSVCLSLTPNFFTSLCVYRSGDAAWVEAPNDTFKKEKNRKKKKNLVKWIVVHSNRLERGLLSGML
ncbi:hypothetical protein POVWA1_021950 [Plasmodium ovale wallikeri]|uniref:Uncharacterized protein n=1 Tax=Plasmodium ovale wallikeri TaxID=864142 RepID=A0A1A8YRU8_PLAOA|nr:hypothetical protein POVWA1_021950 [Plasmodium ovale wallikeri]